MSSPNGKVITYERDHMSVRRKFYTKNKLWDSLITEDINCEKLQNGRETWRVGQQRRQTSCGSMGYNLKRGIKRDKKTKWRTK